MRERKYRAWDGQRMHYNIVPWQWDFVISKAWHRCEKSNGTGILGSGGTEGEFLVPGIAFKEIMDCLNVPDKKGQAIYEGDIVRSVGGVTGVIKFVDDEATCTIGFYFTSDGIIPIAALTPSTGRILEIIGNIYENPELLQQPAQQ